MTIAGKYRIRRLVGLGGMGAVYEGEHVELGKRIAVKIIDTASAMSSELTTRFKREARAASAVESEHIVQVFDVGSDPEIGLFMVMEFLVGEDLEMRLRKEEGRRLDPIPATQIAHQTARALVKAHAARVIHRDLKPANIFLTARDDGTLRVKVLDFGISKLLSSDASVPAKKDALALTQEGVALGTPQYMSPEQAQGLTTIDHRTDIWSLGAVLYEAVAGRPAYPEMKTYEEVIMKILVERPPPLSEIAPWVPPELAAVIHDALQHDVKKRIPDCATFAARLAAAMPEAIGGSSGPFNAAVRAMADSSPQGWRPSRGRVGSIPQAPPPSDHTQVVIRASGPGEFVDESPSSRTMIADGTESTRRSPPKVVVREPMPSSAARREPEANDEEQGPASTGDPTMFQAPAWVGSSGASGDGHAAIADGSPTTLKTAVRSLTLDAAQSRGVLTAALTAMAVVAVGGTIMLLTRSDAGPSAPADPTSVTSAASVSPPPPVDSVEPSGVQAAPPATGTGSQGFPEAPPAPSHARAGVSDVPRAGDASSARPPGSASGAPPHVSNSTPARSAPPGSPR
jgi:serine/threonine protein kinase